MKKLSIEAIRCMLYPENETLWHELAARLGTSSNRVKYVYLPENRPGGPLTTTVAVEIISHFCNIDIENILENIEQ